MQIDEARRLPAATYRVQLHRGFTFESLEGCVDYLHRLGVTDCYCSPILEAREGSTHGYDVVDPGTVNPDLGGESRLLELHSRLDQLGMGILLDIVPNHLSVAGGKNRWWEDVLERGPRAAGARFFDIDWEPDDDPSRPARLMLPFLESTRDEAVARGELAVVRAGGSFCIEYGEQRFPLAVRSWTWILEPAARRLERQKREDAEDVRNLLTDIDEPPAEPDTPRSSERLARVLRQSFEVREAVDARLDEINRTPSELQALLSEQFYELGDWREAGTRGNYRRFFDINELAAVRVEDPEVFEAFHEKVLDLVERGVVTGLRIDHVDGLRDPTGYLKKLPGASYVVVEKILGDGEALPADWPVEGTTGYEFIDQLNGLFVERSSEGLFRDRYASYIQSDEAFDDVVYNSKKLVLETSFASDLQRIVRRLATSSDTRLASASLEDLSEALAEIAACFPVYRSYVGPGDEDVSAQDRSAILMAVGRAKSRARPELEPVLDAIGGLLQLAGPRGSTERDVVLRFQQLTSAVMAKGFEDTALYRYYPLASLNEVGGNPNRFGVDIDAFHRANAERRAQWPGGLSATSTHDTKRSEDVRARLDVLSELGPEWWDAVDRWRRMNRGHRTRDIDPNDEYLLYQTIVGTWPPEVPDEETYEEFIERIQQYMQKVLREANLRSSWTAPDESYEDALSGFIASILDTSRGRDFLEDLMEFSSSVHRAGFLNSISQVVLKIGSPGVPDFYQGTEMWDYSLVDPDNRRPVDFETRRRAVAELDEAVALGRDDTLLDELLDDLANGRLKLFVTLRGLRFRRSHHELFAAGDYIPLRTAGPRSDHVIAFARARDDALAIVLATRFFTRLPSPPTTTVWSGTNVDLGNLRGRVFHDVLSGAKFDFRSILPLDRVFSRLPVALLESVS